MLIKFIEEYVSKNISFVNSCFVIEDMVSIETNYLKLAYEIKEQLEPYFLIDTKYKSNPVQIKAYTLDVIQLLNLFEKFPQGTETFQKLGNNEREIKWNSVYEDQYVISYNKYFRTIVLQQKHNKRNIIILSSSLFIGKFLVKIIKDEVLYKHPSLIVLDNSFVIRNKNSGILFLGKREKLNSLILEYLKNEKYYWISLIKTKLYQEGNSIYAKGLPEKIRLSSSHPLFIGVNQIGLVDLKRIYNLKVEDSTLVNKIVILDDINKHIQVIKSNDIQRNLCPFLMGEKEIKKQKPWQTVIEEDAKSQKNKLEILSKQVDLYKLKENTYNYKDIRDLINL